MEQLYGALLRGPQGQKRPLEDGLGLAVSSPEGTRAVGEGIRSLLERHVEFIHQAHHHLLPVLTCSGQRMLCLHNAAPGLMHACKDGYLGLRTQVQWGSCLGGMTRNCVQKPRWL